MIPKRHANFSLANCASLCSIYLFMICIPKKGQDACVDGVCDVLFILIVYSSHVLNHKLPKLKSGFYRSIGDGYFIPLLYNGNGLKEIDLFESVCMK